MKILYSKANLNDYLEKERLQNKTIGLVPTMGALHPGHISLVDACRKENDVCVVSVFVNPTQFNDKRDLETYPRTLDADCALLEQAGCDYVFAPSVEEMYPEADTRVFEFGRIAEVMEGAHRPGHFNGVAQIVSKLFYAVAPDTAYFGEKDFQQLAIIRVMTTQLNLPIRIVACPIMREADGLAMSSRNTRLTPEQRQKAPLIARTLKETLNFVPEKGVQEVIDYVVDTLNRTPEMRVEYFEIVDGNTLESIQHWSDTDSIVGCITVFCGEVRLIDNIRYK
ncbi:pantoate--beta-alanine ligase [Parabacteroides sp. PFB2-12]|uniref:pantoate--beta-alanine ligase n=1 Tax=unclassified Parabacteroides TaxID=2649774 RepID=UPI002475B050|nr:MULTISPECIES: pantoate--beta-alanine ligase [unclassified Parabacteroides]MDH6343539.1 pantoate--beta-alanine ligase [Parabacteroides sp. PM6-13]MDH6390861.1 pantoate--beta-alanine ligase [Parabacteroides sp. PFB2-12]